MKKKTPQKVHKTSQSANCSDCKTDVKKDLNNIFTQKKVEKTVNVFRRI